MAQADRHDAPRLVDKLVPGEAAVIDNVLVGREDAVRQPVVTHELPDVFDRVQLGASGWQRHERDVVRHDQFCRSVPTGPIEQQDGMCAWRDVESNLFEVHAHGFAVAAGHEDGGTFAFGGADRTKDPGRGAALVFGGGRAGSSLCPAARELGLLANSPATISSIASRDWANVS